MEEKSLIETVPRLCARMLNENVDYANGKNKISPNVEKSFMSTPHT